MFETKSGILLVAGLSFFALAFLSNGVVPWVMYAHLPEKTAEQTIQEQLAPSGYKITDKSIKGLRTARVPEAVLAKLSSLKDHLFETRAELAEAIQERVGEEAMADHRKALLDSAVFVKRGGRNILAYFKDLRDRYPDAFAKYYGEPTVDSCAEALRVGRKVYIGEGCWHCHSQFIRPVANEERRWGPVSRSEEYQNELQRPVMFGTRRVGPDLIREGGRRSNDWHVIHFFRPKLTSPESVMPEYPWFFDNNTKDGPGAPNKRGFGIIIYMQWLGSWLDEFPHYGDLQTGSPGGS